MNFGLIYEVSWFGKVDDDSWGKAYPFLVQGRAFLASIGKIFVDTIKKTVDKIIIFTF